MDGQTSGTNENQENKEETNPWLAAFAALEPKGEEAGETAADVEPADNSGTAVDTEGIGEQQQLSDQDEAIDSVASANDVGGLDTGIGTAGIEDTLGIGSLFGESDIDIESYRTEASERVRNQAIGDIANEFIKRGFRHTNGALGATINDTDICKRDEDGVPHYYNPDTGMEFRGDNPRRQASEWCEDYNKELARMFNNACAEYETHLMKQEAPRLAVLEFKSKYDKLDPIRRGMFDNVIQDFEVKDSNGDLVGYSCDLNKVLALVDRQIAMIQDYAKQQQAAKKDEPSGPVLDMKTSSGAVQSGDIKPPSSLAEAMERLQNAELEKLKRN